MRAIKRSPSSVNPERAAQIRLEIAFFVLQATLDCRRMITGVTRQRKVDTLRVYCIMDFNTFFLPKGMLVDFYYTYYEYSDIWELPTDIQLQLFDEMLDHRSQKSALDVQANANRECVLQYWRKNVRQSTGRLRYAIAWARASTRCGIAHRATAFSMLCCRCAFVRSAELGKHVLTTGDLRSFRHRQHAAPGAC